MPTIYTRKFSQFLIGTVDEPVGLNSTTGGNTIGPGSGSGGGAVTHTVIQPNHNLAKGKWVRLDQTTPTALYVLAQSDTALHADRIGVVIVSDYPSGANTTFIVAEIGFIDSGLTVFSGLLPGYNYFLSTSPGDMTTDDPAINGQVSVPVFTAYTASSGWILHERGWILNGTFAQIASQNGNQITVYQPNHGFNVTDILRVEAANEYTYAQSNNENNTWSVGFVVQRIDENYFVLQWDGYTNVFTPDVFPDPLVPNQTYWLSDVDEGEMMPMRPTNLNSWVKPVFTALSPTEGFILSHAALPVKDGGGPGPVPEDEIWHNCQNPDSLALIGGTWVTIPCLTVTITPSAATSKIRVQAVVVGDRVGPVAPVMYSRMIRNGTPIQTGNATGGRLSADKRAFANQVFEHIMVIDEPNSTSALTYNIQIYCPVNWTLLLQQDWINTYAGTSTIIADEIL